MSNTISILENLISFPSISARSNLDIIDYIQKYLSEHGVLSALIPDETGAKASLMATIGPRDRPGVVLSAHTDVVPVEGQAWASEPFKLAVRDGRAYGRGSTDMKGFLAAVLAHVPRWTTATLAHPVHLAFSYDEEVGCLGVPDLAAAVASETPRPALCIVGEPTGMRVVSAHKGKVAYRVEVTGQTGHSAMPHKAANAVECAAEIVGRIVALGRAYRENGPHDARFDPGWSTVNVGTFQGGVALNLVPETSAFAFEIRNLPGHDVAADIDDLRAFSDALVAALRRQAPASSVRWTEILNYPPLTPPENPAAAGFVAELAGDRGAPGTVSFGTEGGIFARAGIATVVCGPGDMARAHKADEYIELDQLAACDAFLTRLTERLSRPLPL